MKRQHIFFLNNSPILFWLVCDVRFSMLKMNSRYFAQADNWIDTRQESNPEFGTVCHIPMYPTFCPRTRDVIFEAAQALGMENIHLKGTIVTIEGPRFSTRAESLMFRAWGADVINMTTVPEVRNELEKSYQLTKEQDQF